MNYEEIRYELDRWVATITLNRPDKLNAWTTVMEGELRHAIVTAIRDSDVRAIVLTGAGRGFCAGADINRLNRMATQNAAWDSAKPLSDFTELTSSRPDYSNRYSYFPSVPKPMIAAVNGPCAGVGLVLALYCDVRFASERAMFTTVFARRGLIAENGLAWLMSRLIGPSRALDLLMSARNVAPDEALALGLVNRVTKPENLLAEAQNYARELSTIVSPRSASVIKRQVWDAQFETLKEAIDVAEHQTAAALKSQDFREGVLSFMERRPANFINS